MVGGLDPMRKKDDRNRAQSLLVEFGVMAFARKGSILLLPIGPSLFQQLSILAIDGRRYHDVAIFPIRRGDVMSFANDNSDLATHTLTRAWHD
eukprot:4467117-Amphidinium_carterae.1